MEANQPLSGDARSCQSSDPLFLNAISIPDITTGHSNRVFSLKFVAEDPNLLVSGGWDNTVQVWDVRAGLSQSLGDCATEIPPAARNEGDAST